jgi:hypothetical protein
MGTPAILVDLTRLDERIRRHVVHSRVLTCTDRPIGVEERRAAPPAPLPGELEVSFVAAV